MFVVEHGPFDLGATVAARASEKLGRPVTIGKLTVTVGATVSVSLSDLVIANAPDADPVPFLTLAKLDGEIAPWSLLGWAVFGRGATVRHLSIDGIRLTMEHGADGRPNWHFFEPDKRQPNSRTGFPTLFDATLGDAAIDIKTSTGKLLRIRVDQAHIATPAVDQPVTLTAQGAYNGAPITMSAALHSFDELHDAATPFGADVHMASAETALEFTGTLKQPLDADGAVGRLVLTAPTLDRLLLIAGASGHAGLALALDAGLSRDGTLWHMTDVKGTLGGQPFTMDLKLQEGPRKAPDAFTLEAGFAALDLTSLGGQNKSGSTVLRIDDAPGTILDAHITAKQVIDQDIKAETVDLTAKLTPGALSVSPLTMRFADGSARLDATLKNAEAGATGRIAGRLGGADPAQLVRLLGLGALPLTGAVDIGFDLHAVGNTATEAGRTAGGALVLSMLGGTISRNLVEQASTDVRTLFRKADGMGRIDCLLGVLAFDGGLGRLAPLRIRTSDGTILGSGMVDLRRDTLDLTVGTEAASTGFFALDVPVHITGPLMSPHVLPAVGRPDDAAVAPDVLPAGVQDLARNNPCLAAIR